MTLCSVCDLPFEFDISFELEDKLEKVARKDSKRAEILSKKMREVVSSGGAAIERYKNLKYGKSEYKRVHIDSSFVLVFKVDKLKRRIIFADFDHRDKIYKYSKTRKFPD